MATGNYPKYTDEFKKSIVTLHQNGKSLSQLSKEYGISMSALSKWVRNLSEVKIDEDTDIVTFSDEQMVTLSEYFKDTNAETAFMLGKYCGLRINECYGLKWCNVDFDNDIIKIEYHQDRPTNAVPEGRNQVSIFKD